LLKTLGDDGYHFKNASVVHHSQHLLMISQL
jgi:hypothetical protein